MCLLKDVIVRIFTKDVAKNEYFLRKTLFKYGKG